MIELPINQYNIAEIKYNLNEKKTVIFKFNNFMLKDVEIEEKEEYAQLDPDTKTLVNSRKKEWKEDLEKNKIETVQLLDGINSGKSEVDNATDKEISDFNKKINKQYKIDKTIIDEYEEVKRKKIKDNFDKLTNVDVNKCKKLIETLDKTPYKAIENIGTFYTFNDGNTKFKPKEDPFVINDERETAKQRKPSVPDENEEKIEDINEEIQKE